MIDEHGENRISVDRSADADTQSARTRVVIDTDPGVDDAAAILLALASPELDVLALTTVAGNVALAKTSRNALRICELAGAHVPVAAGADRPLAYAQRRADAEPALARRRFEWLSRLERRRRLIWERVRSIDGLAGSRLPAPAGHIAPAGAVELIGELAAAGPLTIVGIAPLTNLARLLERDPDVKARIERFVIMGGARTKGNMTAAAEFNVWYDPEAADRVFASGVPITLLPLELTDQALLSPEEVQELACSGEVGAALAAMLRAAPRPPLHDVLAVLQLIRPAAMRFAAAELSVDTGISRARGRTLIGAPRAAGPATRAQVGVTLERDVFARALLDAVKALEARKADARGRSGRSASPGNARERASPGSARERASPGSARERTSAGSARERAHDLSVPLRLQTRQTEH